MTDRYQEIRDALEMGPTPGPWQDIGPIGAGKLIKAPEGLIAVVYGPNVNPASEANAHLIAACDPDTIRALMEERDALREALAGLITWTPSAATYRRLGFDPGAPMRALAKARTVLAKGGKEAGND